MEGVTACPATFKAGITTGAAYTAVYAAKGAATIAPAMLPPSCTASIALGCLRAFFTRILSLLRNISSLTNLATPFKARLYQGNGLLPYTMTSGSYIGLEELPLPESNPSCSLFSISFTVKR